MKLKYKQYLTKRNVILTLLLIVTTILFVYGWYFDTTKPQSGIGWADQTVYTEAAQQFANGNLPNKNQLHYAVGYPLLGAIGEFFNPGDPFMLISLALLLLSVGFCFMAVCRSLGLNWAVVFTFLLLLWDGMGRSFQFSFDLFTTPWNNQVLFFAFSFYFWLFTTLPKKPSLKLAVLLGFVSGLAFVTREETIIFVAPITAAYLILAKADWQKYVICFSLILACFLPQVLVKSHVLGSAVESGRKSGYSELKSSYLQPSFFYRNIWETIIDSHHFNGPDPQRPALLQAAPWLWLAPVGLGILLLSKRYPNGLKIYVLASCGLIVFYLAGVNMSAHKLKFHCLRYISPGFIVLNLGVTVAIKESYSALTQFKKTSKSRS